MLALVQITIYSLSQPKGVYKSTKKKLFNEAEPVAIYNHNKWLLFRSFKINK